MPGKVRAESRRETMWGPPVPDQRPNTYDLAVGWTYVLLTMALFVGLGAVWPGHTAADLVLKGLVAVAAAVGLGVAARALYHRLFDLPPDSSH